MADYSDGIGALGAGFKGFAQGMMDAEDRQHKRLEMTAKLTAQREDRERQQREDQAKKQELEYKKKKDLIDYGQKHDVEEGVTDITQVPVAAPYSKRYLQTIEAKAAADPYGAKQASAIKAKVDANVALEDQRKKGISPLAGYQKTANYVATPEEEKRIRSAGSDLNNFNVTMDALIGRVKSAKPEELANPYSNASKAIKNDLRDLQLAYKGDAFAKLGVLAGPDMKILEDVIESPGTISNLVSGSPGVISRYQQARARVNDRFKLKAGVLGLEPAGQAPPPPGGLITKEQGLMGKGLIRPAPVPSAAGPKPGSVEDGYRFKGGDPKDAKNWEKVK